MAQHGCLNVVEIQCDGAALAICLEAILEC
jgi:hypothetical protein